MRGSQRSQDKSPGVLIGEAQEALERALLIGDRHDVAEAKAKLDQAREAEGGERRSRRSASIEAALREVETIDDGGVVSMIDRAVEGLVLSSELQIAFAANPKALGLSSWELTFVNSDPRRLRAVVMARREGLSFDSMVSQIRTVEDPKQRDYALAARADRDQIPEEFRGWLSDYIQRLNDGNNS